jgi:hypothetical protein
MMHGIRFNVLKALAGLAMIAALLGNGRAIRAAEVPFGEAFDASWSLDALWDDGQAEVATYDAERTIYGKAWPHEETRIVVAEPMRTDQLVKPEAPYEGKPIVPALKYNVVTRVQTFNYPYQFMTSLFVERSAPQRMIKGVFSSQEWCGATFKDLMFRSDPPRYTADSYWEDQARIDAPLPWGEDALLEDQLPLALRGLKIEAGDMVRAQLIPSQVGSKAILPVALEPIVIRWQNAESALEAGGRRYTPAEQWVARVWRDPNATKNSPFIGRFVFDAEPPHVLLQYELRGGHKGTLKTLRRWAYWNFP